MKKLILGLAVVALLLVVTQSAIAKTNKPTCFNMMTAKARLCNTTPSIIRSSKALHQCSVKYGEGLCTAASISKIYNQCVQAHKPSAACTFDSISAVSLMLIVKLSGAKTTAAPSSSGPAA